MVSFVFSSITVSSIKDICSFSSLPFNLFILDIGVNPIPKSQSKTKSPILPKGISIVKIISFFGLFYIMKYFSLKLKLI